MKKLLFFITLSCLSAQEKIKRLSIESVGSDFEVHGNSESSPECIHIDLSQETLRQLSASDNTKIEEVILNLLKHTLDIKKKYLKNSDLNNIIRPKIYELIEEYRTKNSSQPCELWNAKDIARSLSPILAEQLADPSTSVSSTLLIKTWLINEMDKRNHELTLETLNKKEKIEKYKRQMRYQICQKYTAVFIAGFSCFSTVITAIVTYFTTRNS